MNETSPVKAFHHGLPSKGRYYKTEALQVR